MSLEGFNKNIEQIVGQITVASSLTESYRNEIDEMKKNDVYGKALTMIEVIKQALKATNDTFITHNKADPVDVKEYYKEILREKLSSVSLVASTLQKYSLDNKRIKLKMLSSKVTPDEIDSLPAEKLIQVYDQEVNRRTKAHEALAYVEKRHRDILDLEESIVELNQLFADFAILVDVQSEMINTVEKNVDKTVSNVEQGVKNLRTANVYQKKSRKRLCCLTAVLVAVVLVIIAVKNSV
ncbi:hypothetical protein YASMINEVIRUS_779 [Yasminevirus sp. GU-2018]|uniref:t-SNARE coiled-coil homology domain-containing protein n=1 Tax=Yasminevirus sp. GU-2018 TaxID=2420051 RepID=A0A5K0UB68_9VIRU|nr:hypothetical protein YASMINEVIRUS_779 [Yasminevirus sp. GU-2018]